MKILFIGGTGLISRAVSKLVMEHKHELYLLNRGNQEAIEGAFSLIGDIYNEGQVSDLLKDHHFDVVVDWIAFEKEHVERDYRLFHGKTKQYIFISSASAYQKPLPNYPITEEIPLGNPFWQYSDNKRLCEEYLFSKHNADFNVTVVRPAHTYDEKTVIRNITCWAHQYTAIHRILEGKPTIIPGNGRSLWTVTFNQDFAQGFIALLGNEKAYGQAYHITSDFVYTWEDLNKIVCDALGVEPKVIHIPTDFILKHAPWLEGELKGDKDWSLVFNNSKIKQIAPNYQAKTRYEDVVKQAVSHYINNSHLQTIDYDYSALLDKIILEYQKK